MCRYRCILFSFALLASVASGQLPRDLPPTPVAPPLTSPSIPLHLKPDTTATAPSMPALQMPLGGNAPSANAPLMGLPNEGPIDSLAPMPSPTTMTYEPGDGLTVSMMNGQSKANLFANFSAMGVTSTTRPFPAGGPLFLLPSTPTGLNTNTFDLHSRQTSFGASFSGPEVFGFKPGAFFLGFIQNDNLTSDAYGFLPFNAYGELKNENWRIAGGLMSDVFNPLKPTVNSLIVLFTSGNTGSFHGHTRVENYYKPSHDFQITTQLALSEPVASVVSSNQRILEDNGWPNVEGRVAAGIGAIQDFAGGRKLRPFELGVSGVVGQLRTSRIVTSPTEVDSPVRAIVDVWGLGVDAQIPLTHEFGFAGEFFTGQGLGEYNGGIGQSFHPTTFKAIRSSGGWGEMYYYLSDQLHVHTGYGIDRPNRSDLAPTQIARNQTYYTNVVWEASKVFQVSFEVNYRKTDYIAFRNASGVVFVTQLLWRF
jgi:hypothetical protein